MQPGLTENVVEILGGDPGRPGDDLVAAAVVAQGVAERDVDVQGQVTVTGLCIAEPRQTGIVIRPESLVKLHGGRIRRISRAGPVVTLYQFCVENHAFHRSFTRCQGRHLTGYRPTHH
jgi:hypothetical protein